MTMRGCTDQYVRIMCVTAAAMPPARLRGKRARSARPFDLRSKTSRKLTCHDRYSPRLQTRRVRMARPRNHPPTGEALAPSAFLRRFQGLSYVAPETLASTAAFSHRCTKSARALRRSMYAGIGTVELSPGAIDMTDDRRTGNRQRSARGGDLADGFGLDVLWADELPALASSTVPATSWANGMDTARALNEPRSKWVESAFRPSVAMHRRIDADQPGGLQWRGSTRGHCRARSSSASKSGADSAASSALLRIRHAHTLYRPVTESTTTLPTPHVTASLIHIHAGNYSRLTYRVRVTLTSAPSYPAARGYVH